MAARTADVARIVPRRRRARSAPAGAPRFHRAAARWHGQHRAHHAPIAGGGGRHGSHRSQSGPDPRQRRGSPRRGARGRRGDRRRCRGIEPQSVDNLSRSGRSGSPRARFSRPDIGAAEKGLHLQARPFARSAAALRRLAPGSRARVRRLPVPHRPEHRVPGTGLRRRQVRALRGAPHVLGAVPVGNRPEPRSAGKARPERQCLPGADRAGRGELGYRARALTAITASRCSRSTCRVLAT